MVLPVDFCFTGESWIVGVVTIVSFAKKDNACFSCTDWPLKPLVHVQSDGKNYNYTPRSDFHLSVDGLPYFIVQSDGKNYNYMPRSDFHLSVDG